MTPHDPTAKARELGLALYGRDHGKEVEMIAEALREARETAIRQAATLIAGCGEDNGARISWSFWTGFAIMTRSPVAKFSTRAHKAILALLTPSEKETPDAS